MIETTRTKFIAGALKLPMSGRLITSSELPYRVGQSMSWIYRAEASGEFPKRIKTGPRSVAWRGDEVQEWLDGLERAE